MMAEDSDKVTSAGTLTSKGRKAFGLVKSAALARWVHTGKNNCSFNVLALSIYLLFFSILVFPALATVP